MKYYNFLTCSEQQQIVSENQYEKTVYNTPLFPCGAYLDVYNGDSCLWHWHDEIEVGYVRDGILNVFVNDLQYTLHKGDGIFINTGVLHMYSGCKNIKTEFPNIVFIPSFIYGTKESIFWTKYVHPLTESINLSHIIFSEDSVWQTELLRHMRQAIEFFEHKIKDSEFQIRSHLSEMIFKICQNNTVQLEEKGHNKIEIDRIRRMLAFIQQYYMNPIQLQQIADSAFISSRECLRLFKNVLGTSPKQYVIQLRLQKAKDLLSETTTPISEICARCGFQDQSYFTKVFREQFNTSPTKYRKNQITNI